MAIGGGMNLKIPLLKGLILHILWLLRMDWIALLGIGFQHVAVPVFGIGCCLRMAFGIFDVAVVVLGHQQIAQLLPGHEYAVGSFIGIGGKVCDLFLG